MTTRKPTTRPDKKLHALNRVFLDALGAAAQAHHYADEALAQTRIAFDALEKADADVTKRERELVKAQKALAAHIKQSA